MLEFSPNDHQSLPRDFCFTHDFENKSSLQELPLEYYEQIVDFCRVRNSFRAYEQTEPGERVLFITNLLRSLHIPFQIDVFTEGSQEPFKLHEDETKLHKFDIRRSIFRWLGISKRNHQEPLQTDAILISEGLQESGSSPLFNIVLVGDSSRMVIAHHDVVNLKSDNANDNSASVINAIALKRLRPDLNVVLTDGEEPPYMGAGSTRLADQIRKGVFGDIEWVLNLELTGVGGTNFFIGDYDGPLSDKITGLFGCPRVSVPPSDTTLLRKAGIDSTVINSLPLLPQGEKGRDDCRLHDGSYLDYNLLFRCHSLEDSVSHIRPGDMKRFCEEVLLKIIDLN